MKESVDSILKRYPNPSRDSLIPILQDVQDEIGYLDRSAISHIGSYLDLPSSKIYGVATFYNQFRFEPLGKYHIQVCRGTACHVKGSAAVLETLKQQLGVEPGRTTKDGLFSLEVVACMGACGLAPVISVNGEFHAQVSADDVVDIIKKIRNEDAT